MNTEQNASLTLNGIKVPCSMVGKLTVAEKDLYLGRQLSEEGYLLLRDVHDPDEVAAARTEVLQRLAEVGEINDPFDDGISLFLRNINYFDALG